MAASQKSFHYRRNDPIVILIFHFKGQVPKKVDTITVIPKSLFKLLLGYSKYVLSSCFPNSSQYPQGMAVGWEKKMKQKALWWEWEEEEQKKQIHLADSYQGPQSVFSSHTDPNHFKTNIFGLKRE